MGGKSARGGGKKKKKKEKKQKTKKKKKLRRESAVIRKGQGKRDGAKKSYSGSKRRAEAPEPQGNPIFSTN